jgi:hypothetical protein
VETLQNERGLGHIPRFYFMGYVDYPRLGGNRTDHSFHHPHVTILRAEISGQGDYLAAPGFNRFFQTVAQNWKWLSIFYM